MKRRLMAVLLSMTMIMQPVSVFGVEAFTDVGEENGAVVFGSGEEDEEVLFDDSSSQAPAADISKRNENDIQVGDNVYCSFENGIATIYGNGDMWDYLEDGWDLKHENKNPFFKNRNNYALVIEDNITNISDYLLKDMWGYISNITIGKDVKRIGKNAFFYDPDIEDKRPNTIVLPNGIQKLEDYCFYGWLGLTTVEIPNSVTQIGKGCFGECSKLETASLPSSLSIIDDRVFSGCYRLESITIPDTVTHIGYSAFSNCNLEKIDLPQNLNEIGSDAFSWCRNLTEINIPKSVKKIGSDCFARCDNLAKVTFDEESQLENISSCMFEYDKLTCCAR